MKKQLLKLSLLGVMCTSIGQVYAQGDVAGIIRGGVADANTLMNGYMSPIMKSFGAGLNSGWFQTAKPHGIGGFDITISANGTFAPTEDQTYDISKMKLNKMQLAPGQNPIAPTVFGEDKSGPLMDLHDKSPLTGNDTVMTSFNMPPGTGFNMFAVPTVQIAVGVGFGTEVALRFVPTTSVGDFGIGLFGFGIKHDVKQWIPGIKEMPFDLSVMFGYTRINADMKIDLQASTNDTNVYVPNNLEKIRNQKLEFSGGAWTANVLVSKKLGPLTGYLGLGYQNSSVSFKLVGDYPITVPNDPAKATDPTDPSFGKVATVSTVKDPINITGDLSGMRATMGLRLKLAILTIHGDYTFAEYNVASVGIGLNIQSIVPFKL